MANHIGLHEVLYTGPRISICQRCGGQVLEWIGGEMKCLQCSAEHDCNGQWQQPKVYSSFYERQPYHKYQSRVYNNKY